MGRSNHRRRQSIGGDTLPLGLWPVTWGAEIANVAVYWSSGVSPGTKSRSRSRALPNASRMSAPRTSVYVPAARPANWISSVRSSRQVKPVGVTAPPGPVKLTTSSASENEVVSIRRSNDRRNELIAGVTVPRGKYPVTRGPASVNAAVYWSSGTSPGMPSRSRSIAVPVASRICGPSTSA